MSRKCVKLIWLDSHSPASSTPWIDIDEIVTGVMKMASVGYVIAECDENITIAGQISVDERCTQASGVMSIPKCSILKTEEV